MEQRKTEDKRTEIMSDLMNVDNLRNKNDLTYAVGYELAHHTHEALSNEKAEITEVYDNAVDITVHTVVGDVKLGVYCYYEDGDDERPIAGGIDYDGDDVYVTFDDDAFSRKERESIQKLLDDYTFEKGWFSEKQENQRDM